MEGETTVTLSADTKSMEKKVLEILKKERKLQIKRKEMTKIKKGNDEEKERK